MRRVCAFFLSVCLLALPVTFARAQAVAYAEIVSIEARRFPQITALVDVYDANGRFVDELRPADLTVFEDGESRPIPIDTLTKSDVPLQLVVAINPGPGLAVRDSNAVPRFTRVVEVLSEWVQAQPSEAEDDLSLVSLSGSLITHASARDWFVSLDSFKPDFRNTTPNLQTFSIALDTVTAPTPQPGMKRAILFITPHMDDPNIDNTIAPFIQRAIEARVRVFVWFVDADTFFPTASANAFKSLALQSGGTFFAFSGRETFPDLNAEFAPLRQVYSLSYTSSLTTPGEHTFAIEVKVPQGTLRAPETSMQVDIQPPNPIPLGLPQQIVRQPPADDPYNAEVLLPAQQSIEILVEFPDGHTRPLKRTTLYVDGQLVDENTAEPFEIFTWDLSIYESSGQHEITVEAEDMLGLQKSSMSTPVMLTVKQPPRGLQAFLARYRSYLVLGAIGFAGVALLLILLLGRSGGQLVQKRRDKRKRFEDPVTQPVIAVAEPPIAVAKKSKTVSRRAVWLQPKAPRLPDAPAYLYRLMNGGEPASSLPIPVAEKDLTFGTDPVQCMRVLDDPSISPLHARIKQTPSGDFIIYDHGSVAGTWVNYEPVTREGQRLVHGDRIHFGQLMYRFDLNQPIAESEPQIILKKTIS
jgi:hypothetical protein